MCYEFILHFFVIFILMLFFINLYIKHIEKDIFPEDKSSAPNQEVDDDCLF